MYFKEHLVRSNMEKKRKETNQTLLSAFESLKVQGLRARRESSLWKKVPRRSMNLLENRLRLRRGELVNRDEAIETECLQLPRKSTEEGLKVEEESSEDMLGKRVADIKLNREVGVILADDTNAIEQSDEVIEGRVFHDNLLKENREIESIGVEFSVEKDVIEESEEIRVVESGEKQKAQVKKIVLIVMRMIGRGLRGVN
ncbi:hypothetical protein GH714_004566 [Hevea brasiliensis]|uniref:Uncharacterized protein n=1 Tax=Hevea brasiliensis TaxID=3981 RepID=A0A6A6M9Z2_HEVBR|nr:hypothetical protein GH714_004566 [Hevea brasiliensis]